MASPEQSLTRFESALSLCTRDVPCFPPAAPVAAVRAALAGNRYACASHLVVLEGERLAGMVTLEVLLAADGDLPLAAVMDRDSPRVAPGIDQEVAAWRAVRHAESALPVVDADGLFLGLVPPHRLLAVLLQEHEEDLSRLGGFLKGSEQARRHSEEPVVRRFRHRLPWLLVGIAGALLAAQLVSWFELQLQAMVVMAFFVPGVVYLADAVGTQTETVVVRGLSVGVPLSRMARSEVLTGLGIGLAVALLSGLAVWLLWGDGRLAAGVALALFAACSIASAVALLLPALFVRRGLDPAFGSGPLATVIQDLLSILVYFLVMTAVLEAT